jgi:hypothetical protein
VRLVQIDVVGLQALQRLLYFFQDVRLRESLLVRAHLHPDLGGDDDPVADAPRCFSHLPMMVSDSLAVVAGTHLE